MQQAWRHQGHKPAVGGKLGKAVTELLLHPIAPEVLEVLVRPEMEQHHDEKHLPKGDLARSLALTLWGDQVVVLPLVEELGKVIKTTEQCHGRVFAEGAFSLCGDYGS